MCTLREVLAVRMEFLKPAQGSGLFSGVNPAPFPYQNCYLDTLTVNPSAVTCGDVGTKLVTVTATDLSLNQATCISSLVVKDVTPPIGVCAVHGRLPGYSNSHLVRAFVYPIRFKAHCTCGSSFTH